MAHFTIRMLALGLAALLAACGGEGGRGGGPVATTAAAVAIAPTSSVAAARWRALLVGGDNSSPAFDNGVEAMRETLEGLGVSRPALLTAHADRVSPGRTLATSGNLTGALRATAATAGDACLVFVTSHGDTGGVLLRPSRGLYSPRQLAAALDAGCGGAPTVVIVSACHSGTFVTDAIARPNRIVLTAARRDRSSFGCSPRNRYTFFDACLIESMQRATTWRDVHALSSACVTQLEARLDAKPPSLPQAFFGAAVADLRLPGR